MPASVRIASAVASAIECVTRIGSTSNEPTSNGAPRRVSKRRAWREHLVLAEPLANERRARTAGPHTGTSKRWRRYGSAPMWSSCPCVTTTPASDRGSASSAREIGVHDVDAEPAVVERDAAVDEHDLAALLERQAVHADLAEAAEGDDAKRCHSGISAA